MITVSTTSASEAREVTRALRTAMPQGVPYAVYLNGTIYDERSVHPRDKEWPSQEEQR